MRKILILVDNSRRDLLPSLLLKLKFEQCGCIVDLCNKRNYKIKVREFEPDAFLASRGDIPFLNDISKVCKLYVIPAEGARLTPETMKSVFLGRVHNGMQYDMNGKIIDDFAFISKVYLWGKSTKKFLLSTNLFKDEQLAVSGNGRLDVYSSQKIQREHLKSKDFTIGIAFSIKSISVFEGNVNYLKIIYSLFDKTKSGKFPMVPEGRHYEDYVWRDFAIARKMIEIILNVMQTTDYKIKLRVGPFENINDYKFLQELFPERFIIQDPSEQLIDFLSQINLMLTCWSSTGLESILMDVPVIAIPYLLDKKHLLEHIAPEANGFNTFLKIYYTPQSIEETMKLIEDQKNNKLDVVPDKIFYKNFLKDVYNWPMDISTTKFIVNDILQDIAKNPLKRNVSFSYLKFNPRIESIIKWVPIGNRLIIRWLRILNDCKYILKDLFSGKYMSSKMHHELYNKEVNNLVTRVEKYL